MKKILLFIICLIIYSSTPALALDFKAKGQFIMSFDYGAGSEGATNIAGEKVHGYGNNTIFFRGPDNFNANQRIRLQLEAIASESLSGTVHFEMGESKWGRATLGSALGADESIVELKQAYIDWIIPNTQIKLRMGIQPLSLPSKSTHGSMILTDDAAGIVISNRFNKNTALTLFWARLYNDNYQNTNSISGLFSTASNGYLDNADMFGLSLPLDFDNISLTPWASYMFIGQNFMRNNWDGTSPRLGNAINTLSYGLLPMPLFSTLGGLNSPLTDNISNINPFTNVWYAGLAGEVKSSPLRLAWDFNYGYANFGSINDISLTKRNGSNKTNDLLLKRTGFYASLLVEYKLDWITPSIHGWYSSGDDADPYNGSERMPTLNNISAGVEYSNFAGNGDPSLSRKSIFGNTLIGTWGFGIQFKDIVFIENLKQSLRLNYMGGSNSPEMASYIGGDASYFQGTRGNGFYLTTADTAFEVGLTSEYQLYDNLKLYIDAEYLALNLDQSNAVWGNNFTSTDAWNINFSVIYNF